jgi:hypothetical protein
MSEPANHDNDALLVDDATFARWKAEARACPPNPDDWAHFVAMLRLSAAIDSYSADNPDLPGAAMASSLCAMQAVVSFLQKQPHLDQHGEAVAPLNRLSMALHDIGEGRPAAMFKPVREPGAPGAPRNRAAIDMIKGFAARAVDELCQSGTPLTKAAEQVADALRKASRRERSTQEPPGQKGFGRITAGTVRNWRARIMEGAGPGASDLAILHYKEPLPVAAGGTPKQRGEFLLKVLRDRAASVI